MVFEISTKDSRNYLSKMVRCKSQFRHVLEKR